MERKKLGRHIEIFSKFHRSKKVGVKERCQASKMCFGTGNTYFGYVKRELLGSRPNSGTLYVTANFQKQNVVLKES